MYFIDVILPIPLQKLFTYEVNLDEARFLELGMRVAVPFGKRKVYTGIVYRVHKEKPTAYEAKSIHSVLDETPVVTQNQVCLWEWIAQYYMCTLGDVMRASLPSALLLQSETKIALKKSFSDEKVLNDKEYLIYEALQQQDVLDLNQVSAILSRKQVLPIVQALLDKKVVTVHEVLYEKYKPKLVKYIRLAEHWQAQDTWQDLLDSLSRAPKQKQALLRFFQLTAETNKPIAFSPFLKFDDVTQSAVKSLVEKAVFELYTLQENRIKSDKASKSMPDLSVKQSEAKRNIISALDVKDTVLFYGVTGSGKTEIYVHLIADYLSKGHQVLYLVPEIALTTQLQERLRLFFGEQIAVFHSKYSQNERVEVWQNIINKKSRLIVGARSSILLPFSNLGLVIVDEAHETSYKQFEPSPRYHARDTAMVLAKKFNAKVLLGTATPSIESRYNVSQDKYGFVQLKERFGNVQLPEITLVDMATALKKKQVNGHFSKQLITAVQEVLERGEQVILFQNRRGFAPVIECTSCGLTPQCPHCDVSLTYHKGKNELRCHYCGYTSAMLQVCPACNNPTLITLGFGTEQIEDELKDLFPNYQTARMDYDTTRGKNAYHNIISKFQAREIDILVGTQMLSKGLDFSNVSLVGVINADGLLNFPDFRAHERSYQMLVQVSGRSGRSETRGQVLIQTYNPNHPILQWVAENNYEQLYDNQLKERWLCKYPPYYRLIKITLKHKNLMLLNQGADWLGTSLRNYFKDNVLGPSTPGIARIRNLYLKDVLIKIPPEQSVIKTKQTLQTIKNHFQSIATFRSIRFIVDVDTY